MKVILKNTNVDFVTSKSLAKQSIQEGYMPSSGNIIAGSTYSVTRFDVAKLKKVRIIGNIGSSSLPLHFCVLERTNVQSPIGAHLTNTASFDEIIDVQDADILFVNSLTSDVSNVDCQIVEFNTLDGEEVQGNILSNSMLDANGDIVTNQYFVVGKYDVSSLKYVDVYTTLNQLNATACALKSNGTTTRLVKFNASTQKRESYLIDVRNTDEVWVSCILNTGNPSCFIVR